MFRFVLLVLLVAAVGAQATQLADYEVSQHPFWRSHGGPSTSDLASRIHAFRDRFARLPEEHKQWAIERYGPEALSQYLFQVNKIEGEGFETFEETRQAILDGRALDLPDVQSDARLEAVRCLGRALRIFFPENRNATVLTVPEVLEAHRELMESSKPEFAAHMRREAHEVVFTRTASGGIHVFAWPSRVEPMLQEILDRSNKELKEVLAMDEAEFSEESLGQILKIGARVFFQFENVHPFLDGNGRIGRIILAAIVRSVMPFPNVLLVERSDDSGRGDDPPFVDKMDYYRCFERAQEEQKFESVRSDGGSTRIVLSEENVSSAKIYPPADLAALIIEGVYVSWKRLFDALDSNVQVSAM